MKHFRPETAQTIKVLSLDQLPLDADCYDAVIERLTPQVSWGDARYTIIPAWQVWDLAGDILPKHIARWLKRTPTLIDLECNGW